MTTLMQMENPIDIAKIKEVEKYINLKFPKEYCTHLLNYNGGKCQPNIFCFIEEGKESESCIDWFLAIYDGKHDNLIRYINSYKIDQKRLPSHILPIAHDPGGNLICISCGKKDNGFIYFWDHEKEVDYYKKSDDDYSNLYLIAKSFNEFIDALH